MHQQIRFSLGKKTQDDGPGAMPSDPVRTTEIEVGALANCLELLAENYNLRSVAGGGIEAGGTFILSIDDDRHDAKDDGGTRTDECAQFLRDQKYEDVVVLDVDVFELEDRKGALAERIREVAKSGLLIDELFLGTARGAIVPVQMTTLRLASRAQQKPEGGAS